MLVEVNVNVDVTTGVPDDGVTLAGLKFEVIPLGKPEMLSATALLKPPAPVTVTV